ncbi:PQQ-binding-like beta-propeller repeat protein [Plantactinospora sp. KBS50]|uniref:outer membrane protein assembly factor BamB family protein n=1 Tax=Plantactinospora sp. KBS50 TaxID=2024580 RepID=UPI000BAAA7B0|nr:PQQ-binding-like beta-propeller repeat protein [Plantactinospora sp. KBS50]ASW56991.1 hypothetical protein CIK06_26790 [Plantactinospora sp. KBS50]
MAIPRRSSWGRILGATLAAVLAAGVIGVVAYRVFAPAEMLTTASPADYPQAPRSSTGVRGTLPTAPLIVAGRIRVSGARWEVSADGPVDARYRNTPYWAFRRWPAELTGIVATDQGGSAGTAAPAGTATPDGTAAPAGTGRPLVVTRWSDGELVALDARTGGIAWRAAGPATDARYDGRRTGARTGYDPPGLRLARPADGPTVLTVAGRTELVGFDAGTGRRLWHVDVPAACLADQLSTASGQLVAIDTCDSPRVVQFRDAATGAVLRSWGPGGGDPGGGDPGGGGAWVGLAGLGCAAGRSGCAAIRLTDQAGGGHGWLVDRPEPAAAPLLDPPGTDVVDGLAVTVDGTDALARPAGGGRQRWRHAVDPGSVVLAVQPGRVHLLNPRRELLTLDSRTGREVSRFDLRYGEDGIGWDPGAAYAADGFVAVERLAPPVDPGAEDQRYYLAARPVILAVS